MAYQYSLVVLRLKHEIAAKAKGRMKAGKKPGPGKKSAQGRTKDELATLAGVSHDTIVKVEKIEAKADAGTVAGKPPPGPSDRRSPKDTPCEINPMNQDRQQFQRGASPILGVPRLSPEWKNLCIKTVP